MNSRTDIRPIGRAACVFALLVLKTIAAAQAVPVTSFDDIDYWVGVGANRAAIVIDWESASPVDLALVWGFRWDGQADGEDMLRAVLAADTRLFAKLGAPGPLGISVWGVGYDANDNGQFALDDGTMFDADGVAVTSLPDEDAAPLEPADWYREGWFTGVWSYGTASSIPWAAPGWKESKVGPSGRQLADGAWDSWAFASPIVLDSFAENPVAAAPPRSAADFDDDGAVSGGDFLIWQRSLGLTSGAAQSQGDANKDFAVDGLDLAIWKQTFGAGSDSSLATFAPTSWAVPEPTAGVETTIVAWILVQRHSTRRRSS